MQEAFTVQGMTCGHCERAVTHAIQGVDAQAQIKIDRSANRVEVDSSASRDARSHAFASRAGIDHQHHRCFQQTSHRRSAGHSSAAPVK